MFDGLYLWWDDNDTPDYYDDDFPLEYYQHTRDSELAWFMRREIAWASDMVPDNHLPPIYGRSHVVDFDSILQPEEFTFDCAVGENINLKNEWASTNLSLYYRYNGTNSSYKLTNWTYYASDYDAPWSFTFNASDVNGSGEYHFCSILNTTSIISSNTTPYICDSFPPGPDARCFVNISTAADFNFTLQSPYVNQNISFYDQSLTNLTITSWSWDFDDGNTSSDQNPTYQYAEKGTYTVELNVTDNESNYNVMTKNITVRNNLPDVDFKSTQFVVIGPNNGEISPIVTLESTSVDSDGSIVNWTWDLGDESKGYEETINHTYSGQGYYPVTLQVTDDDNATREKFKLDCVLVANALVNGSLSNDDPENHTWTTIQKALDNLSTFDILYILNGTYNENISINKSVVLLGENRNGVIIDGSVLMTNPHDHELVSYGDDDSIVNMSGNALLLHFNNDSSVGENYSNSTVIYDYSGLGNNGTDSNASWTTSTLKGAGAFDFDGTDDSVNLSNISALAGENVTVSAWVNWKGGSGTTDPIISQSNTTHGYCLYMNSTDGKPSFRLDDNESISPMNISDGWHHIVGTHNGTSSLLKIYVDGRICETVNKASSGIETDAFVGFDNNSNYFNGTIDEVAVWNRTLSYDEISKMYYGNYGVFFDKITVQNAVGVVPCNHTTIQNCIIVNNTVGIYLNHTMDVTIEKCNITGGDYGIKIVNSNPGDYDRILVLECNIVNCTNGLIVNSSSTTSIVASYFNCSTINMGFNDSNFSTIYVISSTSADNVAPDAPDINGSSMGDPGTSYTYSSVADDSNDDQLLYMFDWGDGNTSGWLWLFESNETLNASHTFANQGGYYIRVKTKDVFNNESNWSESILFRTENLSPLINSVNNSPSVVGFGFNVTITVNVTDDESGNYSGIKSVKVNITYPDNGTGNFTMNDIGNDTYEYNFSDTWLVGQYNYTIWAMDNAYNINSSSGHSFNVSAQATISVCTIKDEYGNNETINLTDPPVSSPELGYELLDDGDVLHIWNKHDSYYFNTSSGIQLTNHYDEYWSHNVLMLGYYNNDQWNLIYRTDELSGFNKNVSTDNETFVNATLWKDLTYGGYDFRLAIRYHLGVDDNELTVIPYIKNIDQDDIPYILGFGWEMKDIQIDMTPEGDYIEVNRTIYYLNQTLDNTYTDLLEPEFYLMENITGTSAKSLYLRWNGSLTYKLQVKYRDGQYNAPVTLFVRIGTLNAGQEKHTRMYWYDADQEIYYFDSYDDVPFGEAWATNPSYMVDGNPSNPASTTTNSDVELCDGNNCSGSYLGEISKVEIRACGNYSGTKRDIFLRPVFGGTTDGMDYICEASSMGLTWSPWFDITNDPYAPQSWTWTDVDNLDCDVEVGPGALEFTLYCSKVEMRVTYTPNNPPGISNPYPADGSNGISISPVLNITVSDANGDNMNIIWLSNSSGSWQTFGTNNSVGNGTYHQTFANATENGKWWYWKVNVTDGTNYSVSSVYKFYTGCQSKIKNTGSTYFKGYLLIQVQYYNNSSTWVVADDTINETTPRTINSSEQLGLDTVFNGLVNTSNLSSYGNGTYRIYAALRDPDGDILVTDDETELVATYEFTITFE